MAHIKTYQEVLALKPTPAEKRLIADCQAGLQCDLRDYEPADREVRAEILRYLIRGGCTDSRVSEQGVWLIGALIEGPLDLGFCEAHGAIQLEACTFPDLVNTGYLKCNLLNLRKSRMNGLFAQGIQVAGDAFFSELVSSAPISFAGGRFDGSVDFCGAQLDGGDTFALNLDNITVDGRLVLHPHLEWEQEDYPTPFRAKGGIILTASEIEGIYAEHVTLTALPELEALRAVNMQVHGNVLLDHINITGEANFSGARIAGSIECSGATLGNPDGLALNAQRAHVAQSFGWRNIVHGGGQISFKGAHFTELNDDAFIPADPEDLLLEGMTYARMGGGDNDFGARLKWLRAGSMTGHDFYPQPFSQYAKVLRETGHDGDARTVLLERDSRLGPPNRRRLRAQAQTLPAKLWYTATHPVRWFIDQLFRWVAGYGHRPFRSIVALLILIILTIIPAHYAWEEGSFAPNSAVVLNSDIWGQFAHANAEANPAKVWSGETPPTTWVPNGDAAWRTQAPGRDWETFNRYAYGFDVVIPIINFGQTEAWAPSTTRGLWGWHLWWARWVLSAAGWIVTALGAAAITGLIRRE